MTSFIVCKGWCSADGWLGEGKQVSAPRPIVKARGGIEPTVAQQFKPGAACHVDKPTGMGFAFDFVVESGHHGLQFKPKEAE